MFLSTKELIFLSEKIKQLRENLDITQSELAKTLGLTRSAVNAWEMGLSVPSTQYVVELAKFFQVSTDFLLGIEENASVSVKGLNEKQISAVLNIIECFRSTE